MALHMMAAVVIGVPNVAETAAYFTEFGLTPHDDGWFSTTDGGKQLQLVETATRRLVAVTVGVDISDDLDRAQHRLTRIGCTIHRKGNRLRAHDQVTGVAVILEMRPRIRQKPVPRTVYNGPGCVDRAGQRAEGVLRTETVTPRKLGHAVLGTTDIALSRRVFIEGIGFKVSDEKGAGVFLRCSVDHHNLLLLAAPVNFLHHISWQVDDIDEVVCRPESHRCSERPGFPAESMSGWSVRCCIRWSASCCLFRRCCFEVRRLRMRSFSFCDTRTLCFVGS